MSSGKRVDISTTDVIDLYVKQKLSLRNCAQQLHCDRDVIKRILNENNIHIRTRSEEKVLHPTNYWLGKKRENIWNKNKRARNDGRIATGERNSSWKGGKLGDEKDRKSSDMLLWRKLVKQLDNNTCVMCGSTEKLSVHHIYPYKQYSRLRFALGNGITLCMSCHYFIRYKGNQYIKFFKSKLKNRVNCKNIQDGQLAAKLQDFVRLVEGSTVRTEETIMSTSALQNESSDDMT
jgi:5-methylcytosine-specific restriction endonuclease McrA